MGTGWDDRQERTRSDVLQAARELIAGGGVESLSMRRLAERAGVAVGTLYNQFGDRDGILVAFVSNGLDGLERSLDEDAAADPIDATRQVFEGLDATIASAIDVWKPVFAVITTSPDLAGMGAVGDRFVQLVEGDLGKAAAAGMFAKDIDVERLARHIFNTRIARLERWAVDSIDWDQYRDSSRLGLEITLAAVLAEPHATLAMQRSGLLT
ncbi:MAG TPA: TetR/AcrR family transcriptional regulator [Ilumatobacteraceae bacterium]|jgi:AcrR family transcriptional regulator